jgi:hypothetical protein
LLAQIISGRAFLGNARVASNSTVAAGLDARMGAKRMASDWTGFSLEYRYGCAKPSWTVRDGSVETKLGSNHINLGIGIHY